MLSKLLTLSHVPRWAIIDTTKTQSVADHSFRVAAICLAILQELEAIGVKADRNKVLTDALTHDMEEAKSGDIPTPYKHDGTYTQALSLEDAIVKFADKMEAFIFIDRYGVRAKKIRKDRYMAMIEAKEAVFREIRNTEIPGGWWNRIVEKILEVGAEYE